MEANAKKKQEGEVIPLFGRDEMNLVEFPFGPITASDRKTFEIDHPVYDRALKREVSRKLIITGSDAFGLPRPIDDQVLMGLKALTYQAGFKSRQVEFSRYQLCKLLGWPIDGRSYLRIEESLDRIAGTTLKFKDSWWDKGDEVWTSQTFHLLDNVSIATRSQIDRARLSSKNAGHQMCSFTWNDVIWKSFQDGFIKKVDMKMYRRIGKGKRKEVPLRLYRILDKRFHNRSVARFKLRKLCIGTLGLNESYCRSHMLRILTRAADWLVECGYLREMQVKEKGGESEVLFIRASAVTKRLQSRPGKNTPKREDKYLLWYRKQDKEKQAEVLRRATAYAETNAKKLFDGFKRNEKHSPVAARGYQDMMVRSYLEHELNTRKSQAS